MPRALGAARSGERTRGDSPLPWWRALAKRNARQLHALSGRRGEGLSLLHDISDEDYALGAAGLAARMRRVGRNLEAIAGFDRARGLTLDGELEAALQHVGGLASRMRVAPDRHPRLDGRC